MEGDRVKERERENRAVIIIGRGFFASQPMTMTTNNEKIYSFSPARRALTLLRPHAVFSTQLTASLAVAATRQRIERRGRAGKLAERTGQSEREA